MSGCCTLWSFSPDRAPLVVCLALDPPPLKPVIVAADNTVSFSLLAGVNPCPRGEAQSLVVVCVAAAGEVEGVLGGRGDEAEGAAPEPVEVHRPGMYSYSHGSLGVVRVAAAGKVVGVLGGRDVEAEGAGPEPVVVHRPGMHSYSHGNLGVVRVAVAGEVVGVLGGRGDEAEGAAPEPVEVHRPEMYSYSHGSLGVVRVAVAGEVVGVLGGKGGEAEGAGPEPVVVHRPGMHSYSYGRYGPCWPRLLATGYSVRMARAGSPVFTTKLTVLGTDVVASALVIVA